MSLNQSVADVIAELQAQVEHYRKQEEMHAQQEVFHREQRAVAAEELAKVLERFESFKKAAESIGELIGRVPALHKAAAPAPEEEDDLGAGRPKVSRLVAKVVEEQPPGQAFGATVIAGEVNRRFGKKLRRAVDVRAVGVNLRRLHLAGRIGQVREGKAHHEALYTRGPKPAPGPATA